MSEPQTDGRLDLCKQISEQVLVPMKQTFVGKDEIIDLLGVCLLAGENMFLLGPPGTAKSALVQELARRLSGSMFDYLLTRFTEPNELFGPFDIRKLREGDLVTNTEGMLPEAEFVFLDELLNANSAILNSLLMVLNERIFRRGRETRQLPLLMVVGASNRLPEEDALQALFDRFLIRVRCDNVAAEQLFDVLGAGWRLDQGERAEAQSMRIDDVRLARSLLSQMDFSATRNRYVELVHRLRHAGLEISDRRAVKLQRLLGASALLCGRLEARVSDFWVLRYVWDTDEQREVLATIVQEVLDKEAGDDADAHPRSRGGEAPDAEVLARDLERLAERLKAPDLSAPERTSLLDRLGVLAGRCQWVTDQQQRNYLQQQVDQLWNTSQEETQDTPNA